MSKYRLASIGCGKRAMKIASGFARSDDVEIVACADPNPEAGQTFAEAFGASNVYRDHKTMLTEQTPDIVVVAVWTGLHLPMIRDAVQAGAKGIFAEKPMAETMGASREIHRLVTDAGVVTAFCHQRRFLKQFETARELLDDGAIGEVLRYEGRCSNMIDWGTHWFDMMLFLNDDQPAKSVIAQVHVDTEVKRVFDVPVDNMGVSLVEFENGRWGLMQTANKIGASVRVLGDDGVMDIRPAKGDDWRLRYLSGSTNGWEYVDLDVPEEDNYPTVAATLEFVECLKRGREPRLSSRKALQATELVFATYESARAHRRIDLPLEIDDNPLADMIERGVVGV